MKVNQQQIADKLRVSRVTVTKALQNHPDISKATRKKVKEVADQLGYIPNGIGRSLSTQKTHTIGLVIPKINHSFFSSVAEHIYSTAVALGFQTILMVTFEDTEQELAGIKTLLSMNVDGILVDTAASTTSSRAFELVRQREVPLLFFDRKLRDQSTRGVYFEDYQLSFQLTTKLLDRGFTEIMYVAGPESISINYERLRGFREAMSARALAIREAWIITAGLQEEDGYRSFRDFISAAAELPQAVMCINDSVALGVYRACEEASIVIPDQLSVTGFGNLSVSAMVTPPLTTVALPIKEACTKAIENLVSLIEKRNTSVDDQFFPGQVIFRESVKNRV